MIKKSLIWNLCKIPRNTLIKTAFSALEGNSLQFPNEYSTKNCSTTKYPELNNKMFQNTCGYALRFIIVVVVLLVVVVVVSCFVKYKMLVKFIMYIKLAKATARLIALSRDP